MDNIKLHAYIFLCRCTVRFEITYFTHQQMRYLLTWLKVLNSRENTQ